MPNVRSATAPSAARPITPPADPVPASSGAADPIAAVPADSFEPCCPSGQPPVEVPAPPPVDPTPPPAPPDGRAFMDSAVDQIRSKVAAGEKARVYFDIDDTLADSRGRTLQIAREYDEAHGTSYFKDLDLAHTGKDGYATARSLGLPKEVAKDVDRFWNQKFFQPEYNRFDLPLQEIIDYAKKAKEAGAEVYFITGRTEDSRGGTLSELQRLGLPDADDAHLTMKPDLSVKTPEYKAEKFAEWMKDGTYTGWFITESRRDTAAIQQKAPEVPCVLLDADKEKGGPPVREGTPVFPNVTNPPRERSLWGDLVVRDAA